MMGDFDSFVMFAEMRTGSNFLEANLNALDGVSCLGELFNPFFIGKKDQLAAFGVTLAQREQDPMALLRAARAQVGGLVGFRYFHDHDPRVFDAVMADPRCAKIVLTRNPVDSYVSWKIAQATGQWKLTNPKNLKQAKGRFDAEEFHAHLAAIHGFQLRLLHGLQTTGQTAFYLAYEDIRDVDVLNGLARFLGVTARLEAVDQSLTVQNPEPLAAKLTNPDEMERELARLDRFDLSRTPNFEPRRTAGIPGFVASGRVPVLFMPIKGGPEARMSDWLLGLGPLETGFVQKTLRQWKRAHPGHRSFTVLRHPLARAWFAFRQAQGTGLGQEQRNLLTRVHGVAFPKGGYADTAAECAAFLAFLRFLKRNVAGQTALRTPPLWASQAALVQGFAQFGAPDAILREERLAEGLAWLCAELGAPAPPPPPAEPLDVPTDAALQEAAQEAYARDYMAFGFGPYAA